MYYFNKIEPKGFSLSEVLIALVVIGIVAVLTTPVLVSAIQDYNYKNLYKKAYSIASQAWVSAYSENSMQARSSWGGDVSNYNNFVQFMSKFDVVITCLNTIEACWAPNETTTVWWGAPYSGAGSQQVCFLDKAGMAWCDNTNWGEIFIDTNAFKPPNQYGKDRFVLLTAVGSSGVSNVNTPGVPNTLVSSGDCLNTVACDYVHYCPAVNEHPCYSKSWLYN